MQYLSSSSAISFGRGYFGRSCASSLAMMSLHKATHSSQMKTRGPEISLRTSRRRLPQNEQWKSSIGIHSSTKGQAAPPQLSSRTTRQDNYSSQREGVAHHADPGTCRLGA